MSEDLKAKFLFYHQGYGKGDSGFTLIELLTVMIVISLLGAIALPSFLNQANKAKEAESKQFIPSITRAEQSFYLEKQRFTTDISRLGLGIQTETVHYQYRLSNLSNVPAPATDVSYQQAIVAWAEPVNTEVMRSFIGVVDVLTVDGTPATTQIMCQQKTPGATTTSPYIVDSDGSSTTVPACNEAGGEFEPLED
jgi:prepilin-type N-terminal cleavage/methylation domain-containing protein